MPFSPPLSCGDSTHIYQFLTGPAIAVKFGATIKNNLPWQRTPTNVTPSVANTVRYLRERIWHALANTHENDILQLIRLHQIKFSEDYDYWHDDLWEQTS